MPGGMKGNRYWEWLNTVYILVYTDQKIVLYYVVNIVGMIWSW